MLTSILLATHGRPQLLESCIQSLFDTTFGFDIELIVTLDDDPISWKLLYKWKEKLPIRVDYSDRKRGALWAWNNCLRYSSGGILMPIGNDQKFYPNWLSLALQAHKEKLGGYGCVAVNDLMHDAETSVGTTLLFDRKFCKEVFGGVVAYECYKYYRVDLELNARAKRAGKYYWCRESIVEHIHCANGKREQDDSDTARIPFWDYDEQLYNQRMAAGWPNDFEPVI